MRRFGVCVVLATVLLLPGCGAGSDERSAPSQTLEQAVKYSDSAWTAMLERQDSLAVQCMRKAGFVYQAETDWNYLSTSPHGIFEIATPSAIASYLRRYGYGMAQRVVSLQVAAAMTRHGSNQEYVDNLSQDRKVQFVRALNGDSTDAGCLTASTAEADRLGVPTGGRLGEDYGQAITDMYASRDYRAWESGVVRCMRKRGLHIDGDDLASAQRPFLRRMLDLVGAKYTTDSKGRIHYSLTASRISPAAVRALPSLRRAEGTAASVELSCRRASAPEMHRMLAQASAPVLRDHASDVRRLRAALRRYTSFSSDPPIEGKR